MQRVILFLAGLILEFTFIHAQQINISEKTIPVHPRLLLTSAEEVGLRNAISAKPQFKKVDSLIFAASNAFMNQKPLERIQTGRRLLAVSREAIRRIFFLSYSYRLSKNNAYAKAAEKEMLAIAGFTDWNPTHFLDVAELTTAMAIGYDWLYDVLPSASKKAIKGAIIEKGLKPSLNEKYNWFLTANHNWNQVCNAGMTFGALAIAEHEPELANKIITRAVESIHLPMDEYAPDGAYPEGYGYWGYGTSFNVLFISAIEKCFKTDFGLISKKGFLSTADYLLNMLGSSSQPFNYADSGPGEALNTAMFWFAAKTGKSELTRNELNFISKADPDKIISDRLLPTLLIWGKENAINTIPSVPKYLLWEGGGLSPVVLMRSSWTAPNAIFLGFKLGSPSVNHAHMDVGSFVMDADGLRWAMDFGMQNYESLESKGMSIFGHTQNAQRWTIFRYVNTSHNTLTFDDSLQQTEGRAEIDRYSKNPDFLFAISDLTNLYKGVIKKAERGIGIKDKSHVIIQDQITTGNKTTKMRWSMVTSAKVTIVSDKEFVLEQKGKKLRVEINASVPIKIKTWSAEPTTTYDAPNPGIIIAGFETQLPADSNAHFLVKMEPGSSQVKSTKFIPLKDWK